MSLTDIAGKLIQLSTPLQSRQQDLEKVKGAFTQGLSSVMQPDIKDISTGEYKYTPYVFKLAKDIADNDKTGSITWKPKLDQYIKARDEFNSLNTTDYSTEIKRQNDAIKKTTNAKEKQQAMAMKKIFIDDQKKLIAKKKEMDRKLNIFKLSLPKRSELEKLYRGVGGAGGSANRYSYGGSGAIKTLLSARRYWLNVKKDAINNHKIDKDTSNNFFAQAINADVELSKDQKAKFRNKYNGILKTIYDMYTGGTDLGYKDPNVFTQNNIDSARPAIQALINLTVPNQKILNKATDNFVGDELRTLTASIDDFNNTLSGMSEKTLKNPTIKRALKDKYLKLVEDNKLYMDNITDPNDVIGNIVNLTMVSSPAYSKLINSIRQRYQSKALQEKNIGYINDFIKNTLTPLYRKRLDTKKINASIKQINKDRSSVSSENASNLAKIQKALPNILNLNTKQKQQISDTMTFWNRIATFGY